MTYGSQPQFRLRAQRILEPLLTLLHARKHDPDRRYRSIEEIASAAGLAYLGGRASLRPTGTAPASLAPSDPPHTVLDLELVRADGTIERVSWLMAESHWAQSFTRPAFMSLALWILLSRHGLSRRTLAGRSVDRSRKIENASGALTRGARVRAGGLARPPQSPSAASAGRHARGPGNRRRCVAGLADPSVGVGDVGRLRDLCPFRPLRLCLSARSRRGDERPGCRPDFEEEWSS